MAIKKRPIMRAIVLLILLALSGTMYAQAAGDPPKMQDLSTDPVTESAGLDMKPDYPGGIKEFYSFISRNFSVPEVDKDMLAKILLSFVVEKDGTLSNIKVLRDPGYGMGDEAVRIFKLCPEKWIPGYKNGKPVRCSYTIPININVSSPEPPKE